MTDEALLEEASDQANLSRLERLGGGAAITGQIFGLVGKSQFFTEFSEQDIAVLAGYMEVYRAQPGEIIIREGIPGISCCSSSTEKSIFSSVRIAPSSIT